MADTPLISCYPCFTEGTRRY